MVNLIEIEKKYLGVHEFKPEIRGDCFTADFDGKHPKSIETNLAALKQRIQEEIKNV